MESLYSLEDFSPESNPSLLHIANIITHSKENHVPKLSLDKPQRPQSKGFIPRKKHSASPYIGGSKKRPSSAKAPSPRVELPEYVQEASNNIVNSIYSFLANKHSELPKSLSNKDHKEIELYFQSKTNNFKQIVQKEWKQRRSAPRYVRTQERVRSANRKREEKRNEIMISKLQDEVERKKQSHKIIQETKESLLQKELIEHQHKLDKEKNIERNLQMKEEQKLTQREKEFIIENINNFYNDKIREIKDKIENEQFVKKVAHNEKIKAAAQAKKEQNEIKKKEMIEAKNYYDMYNDYLQLKLDENAKILKKRMSEKHKKSRKL